MKRNISFPSPSEYPAYAEMYMRYVEKDGTLLQQLETSLESTKKLISKLPLAILDHRYAVNKWSIKEVLVHIIDDERIYAFRALAFARNDKSAIPGFEQDDYATYSDAHLRSINNIMTEYEAVRRSTIALFNGFSENALKRIGLANANHTSVRALGYHILGHELHHIDVIKKKYLRPSKTKED